MSTSTSPAIAGPISDHCAQGVKHTGEAVGRVETIAGVETYISDPPAGTPGPKKVILYFADIFSPLFINAKLLQDYFASQGFYVLGLDYFFGDPVQNHADEPGFDRAAWVKKVKGLADEATPRWIDAVREKYGEDAKYAAVGYCFGGPYALELATTDKVVAAAFAHPASLNEDHFKQLKKPLLLSCAETDRTFPAASRHRAEDILAEIKATYHVQLFSGVSHGFATRGDPNVENERWAKEESARSIVGWFKRFADSS
ncbi:Alpha/Beta hydrolase protein [Pholiota molesta]|nr:Alpha/Beta hydrolase protein [Pholiota molesta]